MMQLGTKADTLKSLYKKLKFAEVLPQYVFTVGDWIMKKDNIYSDMVEVFGNVSVIVRSSALNEDTKETSQAGKFDSIANVNGKEEFNAAVDSVISSYEESDRDNQILIQPMLNNVRVCGVAFTVDPNTLGNYYVINYDETGSTDSITSGTGSDNKLLYIFKDNKISNNVPPYIKALCNALEELEILFEQNNLDVEFAVANNDKLYLFQVRSLCIESEIADYKKQYCELSKISDKIQGLQREKPYLCGSTTLYGVMPDWNPAEMIGIKPKQLALTMYRDIITDSTWAYQRDNYGYRNLRSFPLMLDFDGLPYIDVRVSFNSFVPAELDEKISEKLVNYYIKKLIEDPSKHDKIEFDIVFSCYTLDLPERIKILEKDGFTIGEIDKIINALRNVTNSIIDCETGLWRIDYSKLDILEKRYDTVVESDMSKLEKIYWLLEYCRRYGTLPFAGLARAAFIAVQLLKSFVTEGILSEDDYQCFMNDVNTVSSDMKDDFVNLSKSGFLEKYGHLRPGTYDITSKRYDEAPDIYFNWKDIERSYDKKKTYFRLSLEQLQMLKKSLKNNGLNDDVLGLMEFIKKVIEAREYGKFIFTKSVSKVLSMITELAADYNISREDCAYLDIHNVKALFSSSQDIGEVLKKSIEEGKKKYEITKMISLPPLITSSKDVWCFYYPDTEPNYITMKNVSGEVKVLSSDDEYMDVNDKILLIPSADPGYDWIFSHSIRGFITKYGGANSHMAIRAGELGIPAAIGVGTKQFEKYKQASLIEINTLLKQIIILK